MKYGFIYHRMKKFILDFYLNKQIHHVYKLAQRFSIILSILFLNLLIVSGQEISNDTMQVTNETLNFWGSWSSIIGLLVTILIFIIGYIINNKIKAIQRNIQFDTRINSLIKQLESSKSNYPKYLNDYPKSINEIRYEISQTEVILKNIKLKVSGEDKWSANNLLKRVQLFKGRKFNIEKKKRKSYLNSFRFIYSKHLTTSSDLWNFYTDLSAFQTQLEILVEDKKIKRYE